VHAATAQVIMSITAALLQVAALVAIACTVRAGKVLSAVFSFALVSYSVLVFYGEWYGGIRENFL
jgi:hypothetical protein